MSNLSLSVDRVSMAIWCCVLRAAMAVVREVTVFGDFGCPERGRLSCWSCEARWVFVAMAAFRRFCRASSSAVRL